MAKRLFPEFHDELRDTRYPFGDHCDLVTSDGYPLEPGLFLDASLYPSGNHTDLRITLIRTTYNKITIQIGTTAEPGLLTCSYNPLNPPEVLTLLQATRVAGVLLPDVTLLATLQSWSTGDHLFAANAAVFVPSVAIPCPDTGVLGLRLENGDIASGDLWLVATDGIVFSNPADDVIRIDVVGDPLFRRRLCKDTDFVTPDFVRRFGARPTPDGDLQLIAGTLLHLQPALRIDRDGEHGLHIYIQGTALSRDLVLTGERTNVV